MANISTLLSELEALEKKILLQTEAFSLEKKKLILMEDFLIENKEKLLKVKEQIRIYTQENDFSSLRDYQRDSEIEAFKLKINANKF
jgi:hypothetical protein